MAGERALIVDDEADIRTVVALILKSQGIRPEKAGDIQEAKKLLIENSYDYFFLDINLPDGEGFDLIPHIRSAADNPTIAIISAYDGEYELEKADALNIPYFVNKPFSKGDIIEIIQRAK